MKKEGIIVRDLQRRKTLYATFQRLSSGVEMNRGRIPIFQDRKMKTTIILISMLVFQTVSFTFAEEPLVDFILTDEPYLIIEIPMHDNYKEHNIRAGMSNIKPYLGDIVFFGNEVKGFTDVKWKLSNNPNVEKYFPAFPYVIEQILIDSLIKSTIGRRLVDISLADSNNSKLKDSCKCIIDQNMLLFYNDLNSNMQFGFTCKVELLEFLLEFKKIINRRYGENAKTSEECPDRLDIYNGFIDNEIDWIEQTKNWKLELERD